jgi:hypothetical protein
VRGHPGRRHDDLTEDVFRFTGGLDEVRAAG